MVEKVIQVMSAVLPDLLLQELASAVVFSNCTHLLSVSCSEKSVLGNCLQKNMVRGQKIERDTVPELVLKEQKKVARYYSKDESTFELPYLVVGVPLHEKGSLVGSLCLYREEPLLEAHQRFLLLLRAGKSLEENRKRLLQKFECLFEGYQQTRIINYRLEELAHQVSLRELLSWSDPGSGESCPQNYTLISAEIRKVLVQVNSIMNDFDARVADFLTAFQQMSATINYLYECLYTLTECLPGIERIGCNHCTGFLAMKRMVDFGLPVVTGTARHMSQSELYLGNGDTIEF